MTTLRPNTCAVCKTPASQRDSMTKTLYCSTKCQKEDAARPGQHPLLQYLRPRWGKAPTPERTGLALVAATDDEADADDDESKRNSRKRQVDTATKPEPPKLQRTGQEDGKIEVSLKSIPKDVLLLAISWLKAEDLANLRNTDSEFAKLLRRRELVKNFRWKVTVADAFDMFNGNGNPWFEYIESVSIDSISLLPPLYSVCKNLTNVLFRPIVNQEIPLADQTIHIADLLPTAADDSRAIKLTLDFTDPENSGINDEEFLEWRIDSNKGRPFSKLEHLEIDEPEDIWLILTNPIDNDTFPNLKSLVITPSWEQPLEFGSFAQLPKTLEKFDFTRGDPRSQGHFSTLPASLRELIIFVQNYSAPIIPMDLFENENLTNVLPNLQRLELNGTVAAVSMNLDQLPRNLRHLRFAVDDYSHAVGLVRLDHLPPNLETLEITADDWYHPLNRLPASLKRLTIDNNIWNESIANFPAGLEYLRLNSIGNQLVDLAKFPNLLQLVIKRYRYPDQRPALVEEGKFFNTKAATRLQEIVVNDTVIYL